MCLQRVTTKKPKTQSGIGYKIFIRGLYTNQLSFMYKSYLSRVNITEWMYSTNTKISYYNPKGRRSTYPSGFHIFVNYEDAKRYQSSWNRYNQEVWQVEYKDVKVRGLDKGFRTIVASQMKLIKKIGRLGP